MGGSNLKEKLMPEIVGKGDMSIKGGIRSQQNSDAGEKSGNSNQGNLAEGGEIFKSAKSLKNKKKGEQTRLKKQKEPLVLREMFAVDCLGQGGGLAVPWRNKDEISVLTYSMNHVDMIVKVQGWNQFRLIDIYGKPDKSKRRNTWDLFRHLRAQNNLSWCLIGDMNNILGQADKKGGRLYPSWRLKFENVWLTEPVCRHIVEESWRQDQNETLQEKIKRCLEDVAKWGQEFTGNFKERISQCKMVIKRTKTNTDAEAIQRYKNASKSLNKIYTHQEIFWKQRSKQLWLKEGDRNSKFFHVTAKSRRKTNQIHSLINEEGDRVYWEGGLEEVMVNYFKGGFNEHLTDTTIVLIPKKQNVQYMTDLRPVSLCNLSYKSFMECVISARYQISHVGKEFGSIVPERGLRQGDPLSSYLFLICMEGLLALIKKFESRGLIRCIKVARGALPATYMFFANDIYIYCQTSKEEASQVIKVLTIFERAKGQKINVDKSNVFFSRNVKAEYIKEVLDILKFKEADSNSQYLGLPNCLGRNKSAILGYLKERVRTQIQNWDGKLLNKGGKEVLLKTVTRSILNYDVSVYLLLIEMCRDMEKMMCKFWWKSSAKKDKNIHWMSWERMCRSKMYGRLGFRHLHEFNVALLDKQGWRLVINPDSLVARIFKARYYPQEYFLNAKTGDSPSFIWRSVLEAQHLIKQGIVRRVRTGETVSIMDDPWLPNMENPYITTNNESIKGQKENKVWTHQCGNFRFWKRLWNLKVPPKFKHFLWRAIIDCLPTKVSLGMNHVNINELCLMCNDDSETSTHILIECSFAQTCWEIIGGSNTLDIQSTFLDCIVNVFDKWSIDRRQMGAMIYWVVWKSINDLVWSQRYMAVREVVDSAKVGLSQWPDAQVKSFDQSWGLITSDDGDEHWTLPMENKTKVNIDAAIFYTSNCYSYALAAINHKGELIEARSRCKPGHVNPESVETMGIREALSWIKDKQLQEVQVETDCLVAVQAIRGTVTMRSYFGRIVEECRALLMELKDRGVNLRFVKRSANNLALH
ncbi:uncharacterized protein LOC141686043 [Apium graveolens]|uniref:uncharacterized protein LOC141686043 n=1 Tax=Apium graveolens TaxID=4045 RepID=UPI003D78B8A2